MIVHLNVPDSVIMGRIEGMYTFSLLILALPIFLCVYDATQYTIPSPRHLVVFGPLPSTPFSSLPITTPLPTSLWKWPRET